MAETRASKTIAEWLKSGTIETFVADGSAASPALARLAGGSEPHTQEVLAGKLGELVGRPISQSTVSQTARGMQLPRADLVGAFKVLLGIEPEWWLPTKPDSARVLEADESGEHAAVTDPAAAPTGTS